MAKFVAHWSSDGDYDHVSGLKPTIEAAVKELQDYCDAPEEEVTVFEVTAVHEYPRAKKLVRKAV